MGLSLSLKLANSLWSWFADKGGGTLRIGLYVRLTQAQRPPPAPHHRYYSASHDRALDLCLLLEPAASRTRLAVPKRASS